MTAAGPRVSIITPSFNQAPFLEATILSVLEQDYPDLEYIIIDGASTDGSVEILRRYEDRLKYWCSEADAGQTAAINKGFSRATGEVYAWLNSDDVYRPGAVAEAVGFLHDHPEIGMVYGDADYIDEDGAPIGRFPAAQTDLAGLRRGFVHVPQQAAFFRASLWRLVGPLDPTFFFAMDYDLWVRIASLTPLKYSERVWAGFRIHEQGKTLAAAERCWPEMLRVHRREGGGRLSVIGLKYLLRQALGPLARYRLPLRLWLQRRKSPDRVR